MKKHIKEVKKLPIVIASTPKGIVTANVTRINGAFEKSNFINKSERPTALRIFRLIQHNTWKPFIC